MKNLSHNPLPAETKQKVGALLMPLLYDSIELSNQVHLAHWNLRDGNFIAVHRLLDEVKELIDKAIDVIAERARQLGTVIDATTKVVAKNTKLKNPPAGLMSSSVAVTALTSAISSVVDQLHQAIDTTDEVGDAITADILTGLSGQLEEQLWLLESHLPIGN